MFHAVTDWLVRHSIVTDPYHAAAMLGALGALAFVSLWERAVPWLRFHLRRPVTLASWLAWPFSGTVRRRYRLATGGKDIDRLTDLADAVNADITGHLARLDRLTEQEGDASPWPLEPVR